jgi:hypothetical protein
MTAAGASPTDDELHVFLVDILDGPIRRVERRPHAYRTSFALEELTVELADGRRLELVFKDLGRRGLAPSARLAKPEFVYDPLREIEVYRDALAGRGLGTATYYGSRADRAADRYWLAIENVGGTVLWQVGKLATWKAAARRLAEMHDLLADARTASLRTLDAEHFAVWLRRAERLLPARHFDRLAGGYDEVAEHVGGLEPTLVHGELYASNVLVQATANGLRVCPVDWEMAGRGSGLLDLAALTAGWGAAERNAIALAYREGLRHPPTEQELTRGLDGCRLLLSVQWLGWSTSWSPPPEHRRDWLAEALDALEKLTR